MRIHNDAPSPRALRVFASLYGHNHVGYLAPPAAARLFQAIGRDWQRLADWGHDRFCARWTDPVLCLYDDDLYEFQWPGAETHLALVTLADPWRWVLGPVEDHGLLPVGIQLTGLEARYRPRLHQDRTWAPSWFRGLTATGWLRYSPTHQWRLDWDEDS